MKCSVLNCKNNYSTKSISFHGIPKREDLRKQWIRFCGQKVENSAKVCSEHFLPDDYERSLKVEMGFAKCNVLKRGAVPTVNKNLKMTASATIVNKTHVSATFASSINKNLVSTTTAELKKVGSQNTFIMSLPAKNIVNAEKRRKIDSILPAPPNNKPAEAGQQHTISTTSKYNAVASTGRTRMPYNTGEVHKVAETEKLPKISTTTKFLIVPSERNAATTDLSCTINYLEHKIETLKSDAEAKKCFFEAKIEALNTENNRLQTCSKMRLEENAQLENKIDTLKREKFILELAENKWKKEKTALEMRVKRAEFEQKNLEQKLQTIFTHSQIKKIKKGKKYQHWTEEDISQSFKLYTTSAKMYLMLRKKNYPIPSERTLQHWIRKRKLKLERSEDVMNEGNKQPSNFKNKKTFDVKSFEHNSAGTSPNSYLEDEKNFSIEMYEDDANETEEMIASDIDETSNGFYATTSNSAVENEINVDYVYEESTISAIEDGTHVITVINANQLDEETTISAVEDEQDIALLMNSNVLDESNPIHVPHDEKPWLDMQEFIIPCSYVQEDEIKKEK